LATAHAVDLILYIEEKGEILAYQLREVHSNYTKMFELARRLTEAGVIDTKQERSPRVSYTYKLTATGKKVAEKLREAKEMIEE